MSVTIPSDLVVDVMKAADPARLQLATARLSSASGTELATSETPFTDVLMRLTHKPAAAGDLVADVMRAADPSTAAKVTHRLAALSPKVPDAYEQFESFMLRDAFESLLPDTQTAAFGEGFAGGVWRSMAAEQFASIFTDHGGLGIAEMLRARAGGTSPVSHPDSQWPYYRAATIAAYQPPPAA